MHLAGGRLQKHLARTFCLSRSKILGSKTRSWIFSICFHALDGHTHCAWPCRHLTRTMFVFCSLHWISHCYCMKNLHWWLRMLGKWALIPCHLSNLLLPPQNWQRQGPPFHGPNCVPHFTQDYTTGKLKHKKLTNTFRFTRREVGEGPRFSSWYNI